MRIKIIKHTIWFGFKGKRIILDQRTTPKHQNLMQSNDAAFMFSPKVFTVFNGIRIRIVGNLFWIHNAMVSINP